MGERNILAKVLDRKWSEATDWIISNYGEEFDSKISLRILINISSAVSQNDVESVNDILNLTQLCCKNLSGLNDSDKDNFLLALYHILKYLCIQKLFKHVVTLFQFIKDYCVNGKFESNVYQYYIPLFYNYIFQNAKDLDGHILLTFVSHCLQLQMLLKKTDVSSFLSKLKSYASLFKYRTVKINSTHRIKFCLEIINLLKNMDAVDDQNDVKEIYTTLLTILNILTHCLFASEYENFPYIIYDYFQQIYNLMKKHCSSKEYIDCIEILESLLQTVIKNIKDRKEKDSETLAECDKKLKALIRKRNSNQAVSSTCNNIAKIFRTFLEYLQNCKHLWDEYFSISIQIEILRIFEVLALYLSKNSLNIEKCCSSCKFQTDIYHAAVFISNAVVITNNTSRLNIELPNEFHVLSLRCSTLCCKFINKLKEEGCEKYISIWRSCGTGLYNAAVSLYRNKDYKFSKLYSNLFITNLISIEGVDDPEMCFPNSLGASLHLNANCCSFLGDKKECLLYLTLTMLLNSEYKKKAFLTWMSLKSNDTDDGEGLKSTTVRHVLFNEQDAIKEIYPSYIYNDEDCEELLMEELQYYYDNWQSKIPLRSVCNELCNISKNPIYRTKCFVQCWEKVVFMLDPNFIKNVEATIDMIANTSEVNLKLCLSVLYYIQYQYKMYEIIDKNIADMNASYIPSKNTPLQPYEEPPNPNDKCDIVPAFYNMKIDNLLKVYQILDCCLEIWDAILKDQQCTLDPDLISVIKLDNFIKLIAYEFRMQHFNIQMLKTWILYYKFSKLFNNTLEIITSIGFIIEYSDCKSETVITLKKEAEDLLLDLNKSNARQLETYITYYINKSSGYYKNDLIEEGYLALCTAEKYLEEIREADLKICLARMLHLKTCFLLLPCADKILNHEENFLITAQNSFNIIATYYTTKTYKCPYLASILFEISLANGWMYKWLYLPREVRCYTKESILLAQKCVLPIRTAQFLSLLAFTDLLDLQYNDCEVKLNGLTKMLCYATNVTYEKCPIQTEKIEDATFENSGYELSEMDNSISMIQTVLDVPMSYRKGSTITGSPEFGRKPFVPPEFMKHSAKCDCFMCSNCEYQKLILDTIHLESLLCNYQGICEHGKKYFKGGLSLYEKLYKKYKLCSHKSLRFIDDKVISVFVYKNMFQSYCTFLLDYSYYLAQRNAFSDAKNVVNTIFKLLSNVKYVNIYFWSELMVQKFNLFIEEEVTEETPNAIENELLLPANTNQPTTPTNQISTTHIPFSISPLDAPKKVKAFKKLAFDLSEEDKNLPKTPEINKSLIYKFQTPTKTPAPNIPKIKIYTPRTVKSKKTIPKINSTPLLITSNSEAKSVNKHLQERTKLLTEKLKAEKKTVLKDCNNIGLLNSHLPEKEFTTTNIDEVTDSVEKLSINSKENETKNLKQKAVATSDAQQKKYRRIKVPSSSSSDSSTDSVRRKSARTKKS